MTAYEARGHYRNPAVAEHYDAQFRRVRTLADLRAQALGHFEERAFDALLAGATPGRVLDVACGTGRYVRRLLGAGHRVVGSDVSGEMLAVARHHGGDPARLCFEQADAAHLPFEDRSFDGVTCMRLYHRIEPELRVQMLREVHRVGRGWAILFFGMTNPWLRLRRTLRSAFGGRPTNPHALTPDHLDRELQAASLHVEERRWILPGLADGLIVRVRW